MSFLPAIRQSSSMRFPIGMPSMTLSRTDFQASPSLYSIYFLSSFSSSSSLREILTATYRYRSLSRRSSSLRWLRASLRRGRKQAHIRVSSVHSITSSDTKEDVRSLPTSMPTTATHLDTMHSCLSSTVIRDIFLRFPISLSLQMSGLREECPSPR